jgi:hypothetical protein
MRCLRDGDGSDRVSSEQRTRQAASLTFDDDNLTITTFDRDGMQIGTSSESSFERWITVDEGTSSAFVIEHDRISGDGGDCIYG